MRIRDAETVSAIQLLGDSREDFSSDSLALKPRVNLHAAQHNHAFFCRQPNDADQFTVTFGQEHFILRPNPAALAPFGVKASHARDVFSHRTSDLDRHNRKGSGQA